MILFLRIKKYNLKHANQIYDLSPGQTDSQVNTRFGLVFNLHFVWPPTCMDLQRLVWTCVDFGRAQIWKQVDASFLSFGHPAWVDTSWSQVICCYKNALTNDMCEIYGFLWLASWLVNPLGHPSQVHTQVLVLQTCMGLHGLASLFGQAFNYGRFWALNNFCLIETLSTVITFGNNVVF